MEELIQLFFFVVIIGFGLFVKFMQAIAGRKANRDSAGPFSSEDIPDNTDIRLNTQGKKKTTGKSAGKRTGEEATASPDRSRQNRNRSQAQRSSPLGKSPEPQQKREESSLEKGALSEEKSDTPERLLDPAESTYEDETSAYHTTSTVDTEADKAGHEGAWETGRELGEESFRRGFPKRRKRSQQWNERRQGTIRLNAKGKSQLRKAVLMNEVVSRPRAFDV